MTQSHDFAELGLNEAICRALAGEGYKTPTPIQKAAIPPCLEGNDLLGCAQTGTGKTAAFALPILQLLSEEKAPSQRSIRALILAPTRELAIQIGEKFVTYGEQLDLHTTVVFGGVGLEPQKQKLRRGVDILVATPGRLLDLINQRCADLRKVEIFVLDEADRMLDMGFIHDIKRVVGYLPQERQNLMFSATMPRDIQQLAMKILLDPVKVSVAPVSSTAELIDQYVYFVDKGNKRFLLLDILKTNKVKRALIFTRTKNTANRLTDFLCRSGVKSEAIHGNKSQTARQRALENFKDGSTKILVASDIASRGIDVEEVSHVINFDVPNVAETYVHRIGRTGRAQASGIAISLCDAEERAFILSIERLTKKKIPVVEDHPFPPTPAAKKPQLPTPTTKKHGRLR